MTKFKKGQIPWNKGVPMKEDSKIRLSESKRGNSSPFKGKKRPELSGENHPMFGKHHKKESITKMREAKKGKMVGEKNPFYGKTHSEETRRKISEARKGKPSPMKGKKTGKPSWNKGLSKESDVRILKYSLSQRGKTIPPEAIMKMVETRKRLGSYQHTEKQKEKLRNTLSKPEIKKRMSESQKRVWTPEKRKQQSEALKGKYVRENNPFYGRRQSEEVKKAHSIYMKEYFKTHKHPAIGRKLSKERIEQMRIASTGRPAWNKGKKMPELSEWGRKNILKQYESKIFPKQENTKPERKIKEELLKRGYKEGIDFIHQYKFMNKFMCDFCFPKNRVIVEVYGDFWHANPKIYPEGSNLHPHQIKGKRIDKSKEAYITKIDNSSWTYLIIWERDIKEDVVKCVDKIEEVLIKKNL